MSNLYSVNLIYNYDTDESELEKSNNWQGLPSIHRLDALQDFIGELEELYQKTYKEHIGGYKEPLIGEALLQNMGHENLQEGNLQDDVKNIILDSIKHKD